MVATLDLQRRQNLAYEHLQGKGVEFGALHNPLVVNSDQCTVDYCDKFTKEKLIKYFPELKSISSQIVETNIFADLNKTDFNQTFTFQTKHCGYDFFIANHVIEHLINPMRFLEQIHTLMKSGAVLYLAVPNKNHTFDCQRQLTTWHHLYDEYQSDVSKLSKAHLEDFILNITTDHIDDPKRKKKLYEDYQNPFKRVFIRNKHRSRSIHVHVWDDITFADFITKAIKQLGLNLRVINNLEENQDNYELIYILQKI